jgi:class 3 adenylate cyclase
LRQRVVPRRLACSLAVEPHASVRTFVIADIRGYSRFTEEHGDEAAATLAARFSDLVREGVEIRGGELIEVRGDEALAVFDSARQAIRAAMDLQQQFAEETDTNPEVPLRVGIGIDSGEAIALEDGSFRGAALNVASRLCALAHSGEVLISPGTSHLAGRLPGVRYVDRGRAHLKGIAGPVRIMRAVPEEMQSQPWIFMFFSRPKNLGWPVGLAVVLIAAATAAAVVYLTSGSQGDRGEAAAGTEGGSDAEAPASDVAALIPSDLRENCVKQPVPDVDAVETAVCLPSGAADEGFSPDRWQVSIFADADAMNEAYEAERARHEVERDQGECTGLSWGGEGPWVHGPGQPGGRNLCYFDGNDAVIVWTHERREQPSHRDILAIAREGGSDHARLAAWWDVQHHLIGKIE